MPSSGQVGRIVTMRPPQIKYISPLPTVQKISRISDKSDAGINVTIDFIYDTIGSIQYSRALFTPGCGTGYFPSPPANSGAGPFIVNRSTVGANSCSQFSIASRVMI